MANLSNALNGGYQTGSVEPASFDDLPAGNYPVIISDSEMKETRDGTGEYLNLTLSIIDGDYKGRKIFDRLNLVNRNQTAVTIAKQALEAICRAVDFSGTLEDSAQLHHKPMVIRLSYSQYDKTGKEIAEGNRNEVKAYKKASDPTTYQAPAPQTYQAPPVQQHKPTHTVTAPATPW